MRFFFKKTENRIVRPKLFQIHVMSYKVEDLFMCCKFSLFNFISHSEAV